MPEMELEGAGLQAAKIASKASKFEKIAAETEGATFRVGEVLQDGRVAGVGPGASENLLNLARIFKLNYNSPAARQVLENLNTPVSEFISKYRLGAFEQSFQANI